MTDIGTRHHVGLPVHVYPMYENALRAKRGQSLHDNHLESTELYADFEGISSENKNSWNYGKPLKGREGIRSISKSNRMICSPCKFQSVFDLPSLISSDPLLMNAFNNVNLAAAVILTSVEVAEGLGIPKNKWIYPLGGAGTSDSEHCQCRVNVPGAC